MVKPEITSPSNERIKRVAALRDRKERDSRGLFVVEGPRSVQRALEAGLEPVEVFATDEASWLPEGSVIVSPSALDRASYRKTADVVVAVFPQWTTALEGIDFGSIPLVLAAEGLEKPGNLGAMLRLADAVGADGLVVVDGRVDLFNPNAIRASTGAFATVPAASAPLDEFVRWLETAQIGLTIAHPAATSTYWDCDLTAPTALLVGAEDSGVTSAALDSARQVVSLPMAGAADSLNASMALGLLAYEALRQRLSKGR